MNISRRHFLQRASATALAFGGLRNSLVQAQVYAVDPVRGIDKYGQLLADPAGVLNLPAGFSYRIISRTGEQMADGLITPGAPDGMAAFTVPGHAHKTLLVRNHELDSIGDEVGPFNGDKQRAKKFMSSKAYDYFQGELPVNGGTSTLLYNHHSGQVERAHLSLLGTARNCAGGATPWGSWLSCEETLAGKEQGFGKEHGYVFEVPAAEKTLVDPLPLKAMGRFVHEAAAVDHTNGIVYLTEDQREGLFYRFIPHTPGKLSAGGRLQALAVRGWRSAITRNWPEDQGHAHAQTVAVGEVHQCDWVDLDDVTAPEGDLNLRGIALGAARFCSGEGVDLALRDDGSREIFFVATGGGPEKIGQIWRYRPSAHEGANDEQKSPATLELVYESHNRALLESCDNITVAPWGDLIICEDSYSSNPDMVNYLRGLTPDGKIYTLAMNAHPQKGEFCGACFSADGSTLFVNIQRPGMTLAITGAWLKLRNVASTAV